MAKPKPQRLLHGAVVIAALIVVLYDLTPQTALALFAVLVEVSR